MPCTNQDLRRYIEEFFEEESCLVDDVDENEYRKELALEAFDALVNREAELRARITDLESRAAMAAERAVKAIELLTRAREG